MSLTISFKNTGHMPVTLPHQQQEQQQEQQQMHSQPIKDQTQQEHLETCFSFKKQPIPSRTSCHSGISSFIEPDHHQHISRTSSTTGTATTSITSPKKLNTDQDLQLDYDEQIRAPRMSTLSKTNSIIRILEHEPLGDCDFMHRNSNESNTLTNDEFSNSSRNTSLTSNNSMDLPTALKNHHLSIITDQQQQQLHHQQQQQHNARQQYCPATYDLSQPLRRYSTPSISKNNDDDQNNNNKTHQYTYLEIAKRALLNLQTNQTTSEMLRRNKDPRERISADGPIRQIDEPKTPNYIPAVLRPPNFQSSHPGTRKTSFSSLGDHSGDDMMSSGSSPTRSNTSNSSTSTMKFMELPRHHWVSNNERTTCSLCDSKFSILNRKHHCRKCGDIFCFNCCYIRASLNFKLNFDLINGIVAKVCNNCAIDYNQYIRKNFVNDVNSVQNDADLKDKLQGTELMEKERNNSSAVPVDWNWSSF